MIPEFNTTWLAAGGALALIAGFWRQVKNFVHYVSKVAVCRAHFDYATSIDCARYLRRHYTTWNWSDLYYQSKYFKFINEYLSVWVPFRTPAPQGLYRGPQGWVWASCGDNRLQLTAIKGTFDFDNLVSCALDMDKEMASQRIQTRFYTTTVVGSEKGIWAKGNTNSSSASIDPARETDPSKTPAPGEISLLSLLHEDLDTSFKYDKSKYSVGTTFNPFEGLFYSKEVMDEVEDAKIWLSNGDWYAKRNIPWKKGILLHGPGGTGKSSLAKAIAQTLGVPLVHFYLNTLSDQELISIWGSLPVPCVVLFEDIDNTFHLREAQTAHKSLTFDCVLNLISGVRSVDGVYLIVTTNDMSKIDPALGVAADGLSGLSTRPGRIDRVLYLGESDETQRTSIAKHILQDWPNSVAKVVEDTKGMTPIQVQDICRQIAYKELETNK